MNNRFKDSLSIVTSEKRFRSPFRVRHHAQNISLFVDQASNVFDRAIHIGFFRDSAFPVRIPEYDLVVGFYFFDGVRGGIVVSVKMGDRDPEHSIFLPLVCEWRLVVFHLQVDMLTEKLQVFVPEHGSWEQSQFQKHLETVANAQHEPSPVCEFLEFFHEGGELGYRARPQVISVGKSSR